MRDPLRDPLRDPRALDVLRWVEAGETVIATVLDVRGDVVRLSLVYSGQQQHDEALLADWSDWSGLDDVTVLRAADSLAPAGALTPGRIRVAVLAAIDAVHVAPPTWAESVADDVLARLQS